MYKKLLMLIICSSILAYTGLTNASPDKPVDKTENKPLDESLNVTELLKQADNYRLGGDEVRVETEILLYKSDQLDKSRRYTVFLKPRRRSLVLFRHESERGQKLLMLDDKLWTIIPGSRRPIRITASQKLLGEASSGDIATMTWSEDYRGELRGIVEVDGTRCLQLELAATRKGVTYAGITLYLAEDDHRPVKADLYVASGKLAKVARFEMGELNGRRRVISMRLSNHIQKNRSTVIHYQAIKVFATPDKIYNPAYLVRNDLADW